MGLLLSANVHAGPDPIDTAWESIQGEEALEHIRFLASDELEGRAVGSKGEREAADYLARRLEELGLQPVGEDGTFLQSFTAQLPGDTASIEARNVVGMLQGTDADLQREVLVLGAHYDHIGRGAYGSLAGPGERDQIHNGADDNASGVAALLEIAQAFQASGVRTKRSILFAFFTGEERNNLGSQYYVEHPLIPLDRTIAMLNLDMVGRGETGVFMVVGVGTSPGFEALLGEQERLVELRTGTRLAVQHGRDDPGIGDNTSFVRREVPALLFHTGAHEQYHTPGDDWERINTANVELIARLVFLTAIDLTLNRAERPTFAR